MHLNILCKCFQFIPSNYTIINNYNFNNLEKQIMTVEEQIEMFLEIHFDYIDIVR